MWNTTPVVLHFWGESEKQMKNLPARLRKHADEVLDPGYPYYGTPEMVRKAADEIDRLRSENARLRGLCGLAPKQPVPELMS